MKSLSGGSGFQFSSDILDSRQFSGNMLQKRVLHDPVSVISHEQRAKKGVRLGRGLEMIHDDGFDDG